MRSKRWFFISIIVLLIITVVGTMALFRGSFLLHVQNSGPRTGAEHTRMHTPVAINLNVEAQPTPTPTPLPPTPTPTSATTTGTASWTLIFSDDFNGTQLDPTWGTYTGPHGGGKSYYAPSEVSVQGGMLHVAIERKNTNGYAITSGGLAAFKLAQVYGKYEFRARLPRGQGVGPYTILWPTQTEPNTAQVDLFESPPVNKDKLYCTNHGADGISDQVIASGDFADDFHTFSYEWRPGQISFSVDGVLQGTLTKDIPNFSMWFGIAVSSGDAFTGDPAPTTVLPVSLDVDWVRIYKYSSTSR